MFGNRKRHKRLAYWQQQNRSAQGASAEEQRQRRRLLAMQIMLGVVTVLAVSVVTYGGGGACRDFGCYFVFWGLILGAAGGLPVSVIAFAALHGFFSNPARSRGKQVLLGGLIGIVAFAIGAVCATLVATYGRYNPMIALVGVEVALAAASVAYARSSPRSRNH